MKKLYEAAISAFIMIALYTPLLWYISVLREKYFSVDFFRLEWNESIICSILTLAPIAAVVFLAKSYRN